MKRTQVDHVLVQHGETLFWPRAKRGPLADPIKVPPRRDKPAAAEVRARIRLTVRGAAPVVVKITGTATGMRGVRANLRYITERGEVLRDEDGREYRGPADVRFFGDQFKYAGTPIPSEGDVREAFQLALDMPPGTDPEAVRQAAVAFAQDEFAGHRWAWVYHAHQGHPHVHLIVRAQGRDLRRMNPRKADLHRWRETFAQELRARGVPAQHTARIVRGAVRNQEPLWVRRAREAGTLRQPPPLTDRVTHDPQAMQRVLTAWASIHAALSQSPDAADRELAAEVKQFVKGMPMVEHVVGVERDRQLEQQRQQAPQWGREQEFGPGR